MYFKNLIFVILLILIFDKATSKKSFTLLIDTTRSMVEEVDVIRTKLRSIMYSLNHTADVDNFILLYFNDPDVGSPQRFSTATDLLEGINALRVAGGRDCPEDSLSGILKALEVSYPESYIFLFTDAYAKDVSKLSEIQNKCRTTGSQVVIFLTGRCVPTLSFPNATVDVFYDIAKYCSGAVFRLEPYHLDQAFNFMKEIVGHDWDITTQDTFTAYKEIKIQQVPLTSDLLVALYGERCDLQILSENTYPQYVTIVNTTNSKVVRFLNAESTDYNMQISCQGITSVTLYRKTKLPFLYGFTTKLPRILKETSDSPMPGAYNYILIVPQEQSIKINLVELLFVDGTRQLLTFEENQYTNSYIAYSFFEPNKAFKIIINGKDINSYKELKVTTKVLSPQKQVEEPAWTKPEVEVIELEPTLVDYGKSTILACKVTGYPRPDIRWETDDGTTLTSENVLLKLPNVHISYATVDKVDRNQTLKCIAKNANGEVTETISLFFNRSYTFDVVRTPSDDSFEYGTEAKLFCEVNAYPEATIKWYHNGTEIGYYHHNMQIVPENNALVIKNIGLNEAGDYTCEVSNESTKRTFRGTISISGIELPEIYLPNAEIFLNADDSLDVECNVKRGKPHPDTTWKKVHDGTLNDVPADVTITDNRLSIQHVTSEHTGTYRCLSKNIFGEDYRDLNVVVQYAPNIKNTEEEILVVREGELVELKCEVDAFPRAAVRWEFHQDDVIVGFDERHTTDDENSHKFLALWKDSGNYHCVAENSVGKNEKTIRVNVLVAPYIQTPAAKKLSVKAGSSFNLVCNVLYGNPAPTTKWEFTSPNSTTTTLSRNTTRNKLRIENVFKEHEGNYMCIAENDVGADTIKIDVKVHD